MKASGSTQAAWKRMVVLVRSLSVLDQTNLNGTMVILKMIVGHVRHIGLRELPGSGQGNSMV